ncbi:MAG: YgiQ family radical SAM protein [Bacteroidales bacterium]|nr:YgiQ family radical SAM protein [Bacteroidales bacterium]MDY6347505.1 YgiQ family radical SAM protein [Bacteroidales bacterium]
MGSALPFLPVTKKETDNLGWDYVDVVIVNGDAYVDHPSFGGAVIGRILERSGLRVAMIPQPNWQDDLRDFRKFGRPRLFFGVTSGNMDSMVNHYTANKRLRSDDAYTPGGKSGFRPDYAATVYSRILRELYPETPIVIGGIEASMRRLSHYDYWSDTLKPSILMESGADVLVYGMGERPILRIAKMISENPDWRDELSECPQIAFVERDASKYKTGNHIVLHDYNEELKDKRKYGEDFVKTETESNRVLQRTIVQPYGNELVVVNPPFPTATEEEMDSFALFGRMSNEPHPKYRKRGDIPAFEMIKNSITIHRGCFGGCSFCAISAHQGKHIASRSEASIVMEAENLSKRPYFKGHISDLGGPSANMYKMSGSDPEKCSKCGRASCLVPQKCGNLKFDHRPATALYQKVASLKGVKHITIGSGIRYDMLIDDDGRKRKDFGLGEYLRQVVANHVSGRLKVAPEHTDAEVLKLMRKPSFDNFIQFLGMFNAENRRCGKSQQLIPYFIAAHPGCTVAKMSELCDITRRFNLKTEQIQDFTPTPMTYATAMYYLGYDPYTGKKVHVAKSRQERSDQHLFFFAEKKENKQRIKQLRMNQKRRH